MNEKVTGPDLRTIYDADTLEKRSIVHPSIHHAMTSIFMSSILGAVARKVCDVFLVTLNIPKKQFIPLMLSSH